MQLTHHIPPTWRAWSTPCVRWRAAGPRSRWPTLRDQRECRIPVPFPPSRRFPGARERAACADLAIRSAPSTCPALLLRRVLWCAPHVRCLPRLPRHALGAVAVCLPRGRACWQPPPHLRSVKKVGRGGFPSCRGHPFRAGLAPPLAAPANAPTGCRIAGALSLSPPKPRRAGSHGLCCRAARPAQVAPGPRWIR